MKASFEKIQYPEDASWKFFLRELDTLPFEWHFHPEYELTFTLNSYGERYVGDCVEPYADGDLALLGPNLPHSWCSAGRVEETLPHRALVVWFNQAWLDHLLTGYPEFSDLRGIMCDARRGLEFSSEISGLVGPLFLQLVTTDPRKRLLILLEILGIIAESQPRILASANFQSEPVVAREQKVLNEVLEYVHERFQEALSLGMMASISNMSTSTFVRFFRKHMNQSFISYVTQLRLGHVCSELVGTDLPIALIADRTGFTNLSNFNRLFRKYKGMTPKAFRNAYTRR
ncbi:AraC family transcriptional regulator [Hahella ganghwensis]|uniref:AraC family transcriptional regulator n=1 Tax=Hahella ganghwensis TaxID=286420 RepID=UPI0003760250|nr:AraC family transcriptional regulator [Hahella ganghwensis]